MNTKIYGLKLWNEEGTEITFINSDEVFTTMKRAARYGERLYRKFGWKYRIRPVYINLIELF